MGVIDKIVLMLVCIAEVYIFYDFFNNYFEKNSRIETNKTLSAAVHGITVILLYLINRKGYASVNLIAFPILFWIYIRILFSIHFFHQLIYFVITFSVFWGCEFLFVILLNMTAEEAVFTNVSSIPLQMLTMKLMTYIILTIIKQITSKSKCKMERKLFLMYLCVPVSSLGILLSVFYTKINFEKYQTVKVIMIFCFGLMLLGNILVFYAYNHYSQALYHNAQQKIIINRQKSDIKYFMQMAELNKKHDEFVHNTTHYLKMIGKFASLNDNDEILKIVRELNKDIENGEMMVYSSNHILNAILSEKCCEAEREEVTFDVYVEPGIVLSMVSDADLIAMLGNLLDNAIRAAVESGTGHWVRLRIFMHYVGGFCIIKTENSFSGKIMKNKERLISTKEEKGIHGIGLKSVENMAEKYGGCLSCNSKDTVFESILLLSTDC